MGGHPYARLNLICCVRYNSELVFHCGVAVSRYKLQNRLDRYSRKSSFDSPICEICRLDRGTLSIYVNV